MMSLQTNWPLAPARPAAEQMRPAIQSPFEADWASFRDREAQWVQQANRDRGDVAAYRRCWAEVQRVPESELMALTRAASDAMDRFRQEEADRIFQALTLLEPGVLILAERETASMTKATVTADLAPNQAIDDAK